MRINRDFADFRSRAYLLIEQLSQVSVRVPVHGSAIGPVVARTRAERLIQPAHPCPGRTAPPSNRNTYTDLVTAVIQSFAAQTKKALLGSKAFFVCAANVNCATSMDMDSLWSKPRSNNQRNPDQSAVINDLFLPQAGHPLADYFFGHRREYWFHLAVHQHPLCFGRLE